MIRFLFLTFFISFASFSQDVKGEWSGYIDLGVMKLGFGMHIQFENGSYSSKMDIPDQNAMGIPMNSTTWQDGILVIESKEMASVFTGKFKNGSIEGQFNQNGANLPFTMKPGKYEKKIALRPQEPKPPFAYEIREVNFKNKKENVTLAGTLTLPQGSGPFPAVILVSGSGQQNRNSEILEHKPFLVIADYLTNNGIAVLRYDDRGVGGSNGDPTKSTSANFALDAQAAVTFLRKTEKINKSKIGIIGHSEGGMIAPMVASQKKNKVGFIILLAGPSLPGSEILIEQQALISRANGESEEEINQNSKMSQALYQYLRENKEHGATKEGLKMWTLDYFKNTKTKLPEGMTAEQMAETIASAYANNWVQYFILHDPKDDILKVKCPVLALNGEKDLQVPAKANLTTFNKYAEISGNINFTTKELPNLNHLFQHCTTGSPSEYADIEETFSPEVLQIMKNWIQELP